MKYLDFITFQVIFPNGQSVSTITLSVRDDKEPEFAEVTYIRLTEIVDDGTTIDTKGARLGRPVISLSFVGFFFLFIIIQISAFS